MDSHLKTGTTASAVSNTPIFGGSSFGSNLRSSYPPLLFGTRTKVAAIPVHTQTPSSNWNPMYPTFQTFDKRLGSFKNSWMFEHVIPKELLVLAGFVNCVDAQDKVKCYYCGLTLHAWSMVDNPINEHGRWQPECLHLKSICRSTTIQRNEISMDIC
jgi:hypothetical protein